MAVARVPYWFWERANPDKPWLCPGTIRFCEANLNKSMFAVEFGSGRSTRWFAGLVGRMLSIEHDTAWYGEVQKQLLAASITNVDYRLVTLNHPKSEPERMDYSPTPDYVAVADNLPDRSVDFAMVDGHYRTNCVHHLIPKIAPRGYLLVDDTNMWPSLESLGVPPNWAIVDNSTNGVKRCVIWQAPA
jgi:Methyltransferase domain